MKLTQFEEEVARAVKERRNPWKVGRGAGQALGRLMTNGIVIGNGAQDTQGERFKLTEAGRAHSGMQP